MIDYVNQQRLKDTAELQAKIAVLEEKAE